MNARELTFATLASPLARSQTQAVIDLVATDLPQVVCHLDVLPSPVAADKKDEVIFGSLSPAEIAYLQRLVVTGSTDLIVVSGTDVSLPLPDGLAVACVPARATPFDVYLNREGLIMDDMDPGSLVGVMSMRSRCQMAALWPDLSFQILRGGVGKAMETHLQKSEIDGLVIPAAASECLGIQSIVAEIFAPDFVLPSPGQGTLVVIGRADDQEARRMLAGSHCADTAIEMVAERSFCSRMVTDQDLPVGALAQVENGAIHMVGATGACTNRIIVTGSLDEAEAVGLGLAQQILSSGASLADLLEAEFPDGLPDLADDAKDSQTVDEDAAILQNLGYADRPAPASADGDRDSLDLDDLEHLQALEDLAGISGEDAGTAADHDEDDGDEDDCYD